MLSGDAPRKGLVLVEFKSLETFLWVTKLGSFNGAAARLHTTQPAISQRISQLERQLGARLLSRDSHPIMPTPAGRQLLVYAERLLGLRAEMIDTFSDRSTIGGIIRIGVSETLVHTWLPRFIKTVKDRYPALLLEFEVDISPSLRARLSAQEIDLAFLLGPLTESEVSTRMLCTYPVVFVASPALGIPDPATISDLASMPIITFPRKTQPYEVLKSLFRGNDLAGANLNTSASLATVRHLALEGLGIAVIPRVIVKQDLAAGTLSLIGTHLAIPALSFVAAWLSAPDTKAVELVADLAVAAAHADT
jgi:DNA-binding transcriptional LysR family regulator